MIHLTLSLFQRSISKAKSDTAVTVTKKQSSLQSQHSLVGNYILIVFQMFLIFSLNF